jgi:hypothetical protein
MPRLYRVPITVKGLFGLLKRLGVEQQDVAQVLGLTKGRVSQLATGARPLPEKQKVRLARFVRQALIEALEREKAHNHVRKGTLLSQGSSYGDFCSESNDVILAWILEIQQAKGLLDEEAERVLGAIASYRGQGLTKLPRSDLDRLEELRIALGSCLRRAEWVVDFREDRHGGGPPLYVVDTDPLTLLDDAFRLAGIDVSGG